MATQVKRSAFGWRLENIEPRHDPAWGLAGPKGQRAYWLEAAKVGHRIKVASILKGLGRDGGPVRDISPKTRAHRRSEMTPDKRGNPAAPPLTPGGALSRAASYLRVIVQDDGCWFQWRFDRHIGASWGLIMSYQARQGRDMIGFSADDWDEIVTVMDRWWAANRKKLALRGAVRRGAQPGGVAHAIAAHAVEREPVAPKPAPMPANPNRVAPRPGPLAGLTIDRKDANQVKRSVATGQAFSGFRRPTPVQPGSLVASILDAVRAAKKLRKRA